MNKYVLFVVLLAAALTVGLYSLPKVVVRNETTQLNGRTNAQTSGASRDKPQQQTAAHENPLSADQRSQLSSLKSAFSEATPERKEAIGEKLITLLHDVTRYDSAAYYAEKLADIQPTERNLLRAADAYYEAYTFSVDEQKTATMGQKTRELYDKALAKNPNLLSAKANMAMTYANTDTPMKGISLLREVIAQDPTNEPALFNLGLLSMRSNQYTKAVDRFRQILANNPSSRKAQFYLGISLAEAGQKVEAKKVLAEVKKQEKDPQILAAIHEYEERLSQ